MKFERLASKLTSASSSVSLLARDAYFQALRDIPAAFAPNCR